MSFNTEQHVKALKEQGLTIIESALTKEEVDSYKNLILNYFKDGKNKCLGYHYGEPTIRPDGINEPYFKDFINLLSNKKMMEVFKSVTDNKLRWVHHFDVHLNFTGAKGWHTDSQFFHIEQGNYSKDFIDEDYKVYRIAIYLQDHSDNDGGLFVRPGSHIDEDLNTGDSMPAFDHYAATEAGDIIIFDARLRHKGGNYNGDRCSIFTAMAADNKWSKLHAKGAIERQVRQNQQDEYVVQDYLKNKLEELDIVYDGYK